MALKLGKVLGNINLRQTIKVFVPHLQFDDYVMMHFRENRELYAHDPNEVCKPGDWVMIKELKEPLSLKINHELVRVVYQNGNRICPITNRKVAGFKFEDQINQEGEVLGLKPIKERGLEQFDFNFKCPPKPIGKREYE